MCFKKAAVLLNIFIKVCTVGAVATACSKTAVQVSSWLHPTHTKHYVGNSKNGDHVHSIENYFHKSQLGL